MKKLLSVLLAVALSLACFTACGSPAASSIAASAQPKKLHIVTTCFPVYDWVRQLLGDDADNVELTMLLDDGVDLHSYQPTAQDIVKIADCDMFVYVGGESDEWVEDALEEAINPSMKVIDLLEVLGDATKTEEVVEGMQTDDHDEGDDEHDHEHHDDEDELDEHVWLSVKNAQLFCGVIADALQSLDPTHKDAHAANAAAYVAELAALDSAYQATVDSAARRVLLFGDRFPFRYLVDDYGLDYYAAFVGCSAETEASFETVAFLANKVDELHLPCVLTIEGAQHRIAETIVQNTASKDQVVLVLDSMQSMTSADAENGTTYYSVMEANLAVLKQALN